MAEKIVSPGVFTSEIDASFLPAAIGDIGGALIGPTAKGPAGIPIVVNSVGEYESIFGTTVQSGSQYFQYLTSHTARNYLKHAGSLTVVRVLGGSPTKATASILTDTTPSTGNTATGSISIISNSAHIGQQITIGSTEFVVVTDSVFGTANQTATEMFVPTGSTVAALAANFSNAINSSSVNSLNVSSSVSSSGGNAFIRITGSVAGTSVNTTMASGSTGAGFGFNVTPGSATVGASTTTGIGGGTDGDASVCFKLHTISDGAILNNRNSDSSNVVLDNCALTSGSSDNIRWEVSSKNNKKGIFTLLIRRGDDTYKRKQVLETWNNLSLDPNSPNYILKVIGDQVWTVRDGGSSDPYLQLSGSYPNKSKYVRAEVVKQTLDYLDPNGNLREGGASASLPAQGSGSYAGSFVGGSNGFNGFDGKGNQTGDIANKVNWYEDISTQTQGLYPETANSGSTAYLDALNILKNQDEYDINLIMLPGIVDSLHNTVASKAVDIAEDRGDCFVILDPVPYGSELTSATTEAETRDSNYAAMYWPWIQIPDNLTGTPRWVPPSVAIPGIYAFNDKIAHEWFAPAGLNRGGIDVAIQAERKLTHANRDTLYESNMNPIATFPGQGVTVWGQKTLQKKSSALDRINVRRLLIRVKKFIASTSRFLVFEQNNTATRQRFLNIVNPYLEQVQANSGLNAFRVKMDETNNTADVVDRNQLYGQIFVQPTRTAEFIILDFTVQPTGATFPE